MTARRIRLGAFFAGVSLLAGACAFALAKGVGAASAGSTLPPVASSVMSALNASQTDFTPASPSATPAISEDIAVSDAIANAPWGGSATGASLVEAGDGANPSVAPTLSWLVSMQPPDAVYAAGGGPAGSQAAAANVFVVVINASTGAFEQAIDGYVPSASTAQDRHTARGRHRSTDAHYPPICGRKVDITEGPVDDTIFVGRMQRSHSALIGVGSNRLVDFRTKCTRGVSYRLSSHRSVQILQVVRPSRGRGAVALVIHAKRSGSTEVTATRDHRLIGRVRVVARRVSSS